MGEKSDVEEEFRTNFGDDPAGTVLNELVQVNSQVQALRQEVDKLRQLIREANPEKFDKLETKEVLREIRDKLKSEE